MFTPSHKDLVRMLEDATQDVFSTMLNIALNSGEAYLEKTAALSSSGVFSLIGIAGPWAGTGSIACSAPCACKLAGYFMMAEYSAVDDEVLDAIAELTNMIIGNVKTKLEEQLGPMCLSIPSVIYGRNFTSRTLGQQEWTVVPFDCQGDRLEVQLFLAPERAHAKPKLAHADVTA